MKKLTVLIFCSLAIMSGSLFAQTANQGANNGQSFSALQAQIDALQAQLNATNYELNELRSLNNPSVAGSSYRVFYQLNSHYVLNWLPLTGKTLIQSRSTIAFDSDGTGTWEIDFCDGKNVKNPDWDNGGPNSEVLPFPLNCSGTFSVNWVQSGNQLTFEAYREDGSYWQTVNDLWVSSTGEVIVAATQPDFAVTQSTACDPAGGNDCTTSSFQTSMRVAIRLD